MTQLDLTTVIAAFTEEQAQMLTGLTKSRLRYWARTGFFMPSFIEENARLPFSRFYSFRDIVALRTLELLRVQNGVPLQNLRKVAENLSYLKDENWTKTILYVANRRVIDIDPETGNPRESVSGQFVVPIELKAVIKAADLEIEQMRQRSRSDLGHIAKAPGICHSAPVVAGTRVPVGAILRLHDDGFSAQQIIAEYPDLALEDIDAALKYGAEQAA